MSDSKKILPCPFCNGKAEIYMHYPPFGRRVRITVRCTQCRANSGEWGMIDKAIEAWNRRVPVKDEYEVYG